MAQPTDDFNALERAVLEWLKETYQDERLTGQIDAAVFNRRDWTKVGYYVYFDVPRDLPMLYLKNLGGGWPVNGPLIESQDIDYGGDTIIWGTDGYLDCIEMVSFGDYFAEEVGDFKLKGWEKQNGA